jgi:hypothetical protein
MFLLIGIYNKVVAVIIFKLQHFYFLTSYAHNFQRHSLKMIHILTIVSLYVIGLLFLFVSL